MTPERWQHIENLFQSALAHESGERAAFLDEACAGDAALRREVELLIASHEQAGSFMNAAAFEVAAERLADEQAGSMIGKTIAHYKILSLLGAGGMGEVYLASDTRMDRQVALKVLHGYFTDDAQRVARFQQEARAVLALNHPNIVTIYEIGEADGVEFIASELIAGETLRASLTRADLKLSEALEIAIQVASALAAAHQAGIVHRDVKPENIMLRPDGYVKVLDFGIAKLTERPAPATSTEAPTMMKVNTAPGMVMGTAQYMSPEQARGIAVDVRTDVWSLGCVLYEMIAGRVPFDGATTSDVIAAILEKPPPPLSRYAPDAPTELQWIVNRALRKNQEERYQTIKELLGDLRELKQELDIQTRIERDTLPEANDQRSIGTHGARPLIVTTRATARSDEVAIHTTSSAEYLVGEVKRHRRGFGIAALAVLLLTVIGVGSWFYTRHSSNATQIESIAVLPFVNESGNADVEYLSDGMTETLIGSLSQIPKLNVKARSSVFRFKGKETDLQKIAQDLNVQAILTGRVAQRGEQLTLSLELVDAKTENVIWSEQYTRQQADLVSLQSEIARDVSNKLKTKLSGGDERKVAKTYTANAEAYQLYLQGRYHWNKRTGDGLKKSIEYFNQAIALDPHYALAYVGLADSYLLLPEYNNNLPSETYPKARAAAQRALEIDNTLGEAFTTLAMVKQNFDWDFAGAERDFQKAIALNPNYATAHQWYGEFLAQMGRKDESIAELRRAQELDPLSLIINNQIGTSLLFARRYDEGIAQLKKVIEMDANFASAHTDLGFCYSYQGRHDEAVAELQRAVALASDNPSPRAGLAYVLAKSGKRGEAQKILEQLKAQQRSEYVDSGFFAVIHGALGEKDAAFADLEKAWIQLVSATFELRG